jgi:hypothetical protein
MSRILDKVLFRWKNQVLVKMLNIWQEKLREKKLLRQRLAAIIFRWHNKGLTVALNTWIEVCAEAQRQRDVMAKILYRCASCVCMSLCVYIDMIHVQCVCECICACMYACV